MWNFVAQWWGSLLLLSCRCCFRKRWLLPPFFKSCPTKFLEHFWLTHILFSIKKCLCMPVSSHSCVEMSSWVWVDLHNCMCEHAEGEHLGNEPAKICKEKKIPHVISSWNQQMRVGIKTWNFSILVKWLPIMRIQQETKKEMRNVKIGWYKAASNVAEGGAANVFATLSEKKILVGKCQMLQLCHIFEWLKILLCSL